MQSENGQSQDPSPSVAKKLINFCLFISHICMAAMITLVTTNCILRYVLGRPLYWGDEIMIYLMILMAFLCFGYMLIESRHVRMTALTGKMSEAAQGKLWIFTSLLTLVYSGFLLAAMLYITKDAFEMGEISTITGHPVGPWQALICFGLCILLFASLLYLINKIRELTGNKEKGEPKPKVILES
ncbi:MAG: TRAP transporter small permease [Syntrophaceae bacterium]|nr:TRAP transporter small permease [Syntrophaceae bacterium]